MAEPGAGTPVQGSIDVDLIGRRMVVALLSPGAGDGPDQAVVRDVGAFLGQALGAGLDQLVAVGVGKTPEEALRLVLDLPAEAVPKAQLSDTAATVLALRVHGDVHGAVPLADLSGQPDPDSRETPLTPDDQKQLSSAGVAAVVGAWSMQNAKNWLDACLGTFDDEYLDTWESRLAFAQGWDTIFNAATLGPFVEIPTADDGNRVHREIQARFRREYGPGPTRPVAEILIERTIYRPTGITTLSKARKESKLYRRLWLALRSPKTGTGSLRLDLAALNSFTIWEVKPVGNLAAGVVQLFYYCSSQNCLAAVQSAPERLMPSATPLARPVLWPVKLPSVGLGGATRPRFAVPFQVPHCPGVVGYVTIVLPSLKNVTDAAQLAILLGHFRDLTRRMRKLRGQLEGGDSANDDIDSDFGAAALVFMLGAILLVGAVAYGGPAVVAALATIEAEALATGAAAGTLLLSAVAAAQDEVTPPALDSPEEVGTGGAIVLQTFAGDIVAEGPRDAFRALSAVCSTLWLGLGREP